MLTIIDYGAGNLFSLLNAVKKLGFSAKVTEDANAIISADKLILPGVGAYKKAMQILSEKGLTTAIKTAVSNNTPLLGICLGMQILFDKSFEFGITNGLSLIPGEVRPIKELTEKGTIIPHMGWNYLVSLNSSTIEVAKGGYVYFVHSYAAVTNDCNIINYCMYEGLKIPATVKNPEKEIYGTQFHPEKSGETGLLILEKFLKI